MTKKQRGRPARTPELGEVLFVRTNIDLVQGLDKLVEREQQSHPGRTVTRADIIRDILYQAIKNDA